LAAREVARIAPPFPCVMSGMITSREYCLAGSAIFGGLALAWMLPPTKPIGGPTVSELSRSVAGAAQAAVPIDPIPAPEPTVPTQVQTPPVYDPQLPPVDLRANAPTAHERAIAEADYAQYGDAHFAGDGYGPRTDQDDYGSAFRRGYRTAERQRITNIDDCDQFDDPARGDGCRKYVDEAEQPELGYDGPDA